LTSVKCDIETEYSAVLHLVSRRRKCRGDVIHRQIPLMESFTQLLDRHTTELSKYVRWKCCTPHLPWHVVGPFPPYPSRPSLAVFIVIRVVITILCRYRLKRIILPNGNDFLQHAMTMISAAAATPLLGDPRGLEEPDKIGIPRACGDHMYGRTLFDGQSDHPLMFGVRTQRGRIAH